MKILVCIYSVCFGWLTLQAQNNAPILERKVTLKITNQPLGKVLNIVSETANFNFSYTSNILKVNKIVTIHAENRTVKDVLDQLFNKEIKYQQIGNHLVLQKKIIPKQNATIKSLENKPTKYNYAISGYIRDISTGDALNNVSIYEKQTLTASTSGDFGYYKLNITSKSNEILLKISNQNYKDTSLKIVFENNGLIDLNINLQSTLTHSLLVENSALDTGFNIAFNDSNKTIIKDSFFTKKQKLKVQETQIGRWFISKYQTLNEKNIRDSFYRNWQVSFVPPIGSNGKLSNLVTNKLSFNALIGYNGGVNGAEFGGLFNIIRQNVRGAQFAGIANMVGGQVLGAQFAGIANHTIGNVEGAQFAGIYNYNHQQAYGAQFAGIANVNRGDFDGFQAAGICNLAAKNTKATQLSGIVNVANHIQGGQIAGVVNIAKKITGYQIGLINIADSADGITLGLINFIKNGVHQLEINYNENNMFGINYRSGTGKLYSILSFNSKMPIGGVKSLMSYGYSIGSNITLSKRLLISLAMGSNQFAYRFNSDNLQLHNHFKADLEIKLIKGIALFGGASLNHLIVDTRAPDYLTTFKNMGTTKIWQNNGLYAQHAWFGYQFGIRLF